MYPWTGNSFGFMDDEAISTVLELVNVWSFSCNMECFGFIEYTVIKFPCCLEFIIVSFLEELDTFTCLKTDVLVG